LAKGGPSGAWVLSLGVLCNIVLSCIFMSSTPLAEEKEKHTLNVLMNSSVNGIEYFIGSMLPAFLITVITNVLLVIVSGLSWKQIPIGGYLLMTLISTVTSIMIGYTISVFSSNKSKAGILSLIPMFFLACLPIFKVFNQTLAKFIDYTYSGIMANFITESVGLGHYQWNVKDCSILLIWLIVFVTIPLLTYKYKNIRGNQNEKDN